MFCLQVQADSAALPAEEQSLQVPQIDTGILQKIDPAFACNVAELLFGLGVFMC